MLKIKMERVIYMKIVYASRTGNVESIIESLDIEDHFKNEDGNDIVNED